jgi:putative transposase
VERYNWICHAYCLMGNHYHLLIETPDANLSQGMRQLNGIYTQKFNRRHGRVGHVFQGRFKSVLVEKDSYLLELCRYIVLNPVRARIVTHPEDYPWSSFTFTAGSGKSPEFLSTDWVLAQFGRNRKEARKRYGNSFWMELPPNLRGRGLSASVFSGMNRFLKGSCHI